MSYRNLPGPAPNQPAVSAPVGTRGILAEVRAPLPPRHSRNLVMQPHGNSSLRFGATKEGSKQDAIPIPPSLRRGGTMSRGNFGGRSVRQPDAFAWLSSVRVGNQRDGSSGASARGSKPNSQSRPPSGKRGEADTAGGKPDDRRDAEMPSLQEECAHVHDFTCDHMLKASLESQQFLQSYRLRRSSSRRSAYLYCSLSFLICLAA